MLEYDETKLSVPIQCDVDVRSLAKLIMYWEDAGNRSISVSELVKFAVNIGSDRLLKVSDELATLEEAKEFLIDRNLIYVPKSKLTNVESPDWWCMSSLRYEFGEYVSERKLQVVKQVFDDSNTPSKLSYHQTMLEVYRVFKERKEDVPLRLGHYSLIHYRKWREKGNE